MIALVPGLTIAADMTAHDNDKNCDELGKITAKPPRAAGS
jgi:hypothetical protein